MLQFLIGTAGTGKTAALTARMEEVVKAGGKAILLVPEQLSFESEKRLHRSLGPRLSLQVEVLSFTRLCNSIFRAFGGLANTPVTPAAKYLLMSIAVEELKDSLIVYRKSLGSVSFLQTLVETCGEFKTAGITAGRLADFAKGCDGLLADKLTDLSAVYGAYQALLTQGYSDGDDDLIRACAILENNNFFGEYSLFVDGFTTFMAAEFELLGHAVAQAGQVVFAMTCDGLEDAQKGMGVYSPVKSAISRLTRLARAGGTAVAEPVVCGEARRFADGGALAHISRHFMAPAASAFAGNHDSLRLHSAADRYAEIEYVAASIAALVRDESLRYRQIAVVARDTAPYLRALETVFAGYNIPYFTDEPRPVENHPLVAGLLHAVDAVRSNYDAESVLLLAKSPLLGLDPEAVARLDNYCYCWGVRGAVWAEEFSLNPRGLAGPLTEEDMSALAGINRVREALIGPLQALKEALGKGTGLAFAAGLFDYLQAVKAGDNLTAYADLLPPDEKTTFLNESAQIWDVVVGILDIFGTVLGRIRMNRARLCELLRLALGTAEIGLPPQTLDQVLVGKADRIRPVDIRAVFVIGAVEGEFPAQISPSGVFSDAERQQMIDAGVEISAPTLQKSVLEKFFAYFALTLGSDRLTVSWPRAGLTGQELMPSVIVSGLRELFPGLGPERADATLYLAGNRPAFRLLAEEYGSGSVMEATLRAYFARSDHAAVLARMDRASRRPPYRLGDRAMARGLFGDRMRLSPTRVERYYRCPFSYFAADGLGLKKRRKVEFTPLESGSVIHNVLQVMVQRHGGKGLAELPEQQLKDEIHAIIREYLAARVEDVDKLPTRFKYLFGRLTGMLARLLRHIGKEFQQSEFSPEAFELPINLQEGVEPLRLETADGVSVVVEGVIDRVDIMKKNGKRYVRVVDYKSGAKSFALHDILYGLNLQMLLYLFTIQENGTGELAETIPAGVLYMPVREHFISESRDAGDEKLAAEREKQWRMSGLLLEDEEVLRGMEREVAGVFIPAKLGKNGLDAKSSLAGKAEMGRLSRKVKEMVVKMAESLTGGGIGATPVLAEDYLTCEYCDYRAVCGFEPGDPIREVAKIERPEIYKLLEEEEQAHG